MGFLNKLFKCYKLIIQHVNTYVLASDVFSPKVNDGRITADEVERQSKQALFGLYHGENGDTLHRHAD
jgi:hypothetical protein